MKKKIKNILSVILIVVITLSAIVLFASCKKTGDILLDTTNDNASNPANDNSSESVETSVETKVEVGYAAPDFSVELLSGETVKLSDYKGKVVFINFWATWCPPCVSEMPDIQKLSDNYPDDLVVLAVNYGEKKDKVADFISNKNYTIHVGIDENGDISKLYPSNGIPYTIVIDAKGIITQTQLGTGDDIYSVYEGYVKDALGK